MKYIKEVVKQKASSLKDEVIRIRRHLHRFPELSFKETDTALFIEKYLDEHGIHARKRIAGNGIIARIDGRSENGMVIAVRAEMDALPITESHSTDYCSNNPGVMHACGHDAHMSMLLGCARIISELSHCFDGTLLAIFQPGEEKSPGGAKLIINSGELSNPKPDIFLAQHVLPELETGKVGYIPGKYMASCDEIYIRIHGQGGHAALPATTTDQIYIASKLVVKLREGMAARIAENNIPTVLGIGKISGRGATNIVPDTVGIEGTLRTFDENWRQNALEHIRFLTESTAAEFGVKSEINIVRGYPVLCNDTVLTENAVKLSRELLGDENVEVFEDVRMSSDDFSFYSGLAPSLYYRIGLRKKNAQVKKLHTPEFDIDENGLETGVANLSWLILNLLSKSSN